MKRLIVMVVASCMLWASVGFCQSPDWGQFQRQQQQASEQLYQQQLQTQQFIQQLEMQRQTEQLEQLNRQMQEQREQQQQQNSPFGHNPFGR